MDNKHFVKVIRIGVLASGDGTNFEALANAISQRQLPLKIVLLVVNNPECGARLRAERLGIPFEVINHRCFDSINKFENKIHNSFKDVDAEAIIMAGWMRIVSSNLINNYSGRIINIHPSLLPSFKGANAVEQALKFGVKVTGCTVHYVTEEIDEGPIILQKAVPIFDDDDPKKLMNRIKLQENLLLPKAVMIAFSKWSHG